MELYLCLEQSVSFCDGDDDDNDDDDGDSLILSDLIKIW